MNVMRCLFCVCLAFLSGCMRISTPDAGIERTSDVKVAFFEGRFTSQSQADKGLPHYLGLTGTVIRTGAEDFDFTGIDATLVDPRQRIRTLNGFRLLGAGYTHEVNGLALGGISNMDVFRGVKLDLVGGNVSERADGVLMAPGWVMAEDSKGVLVGALTRAKSHAGIQLGLINYASDLRGIQIGLINLVPPEGWAMFPIPVPLFYIAFD